MKKIICLLLCLVTVLGFCSLCGCKEEKAEKSTYKIDLAVNINEGYTWKYTLSDEKALKIDESFKSVTDELNGISTFKLTALKPGKVSILFTLSDVSGDIRTVANYDIIIDKKLNFVSVKTDGDYYD